MEVSGEFYCWYVLRQNAFVLKSGNQNNADTWHEWNNLEKVLFPLFPKNIIISPRFHLSRFCYLITCHHTSFGHFEYCACWIIQQHATEQMHYCTVWWGTVETMTHNMDRKWNTKKRTGPTLIQQIIHFNHNLVRADEHLIHDCVVKYAYVHVSYGVLFSWNEHSLHDRTTTNRSFAWWMHHKNDVKRTQPSYYNYTCQLQIFTFISWINNQFALTRTSQMDCIW